ncbi:hypothetical protein CYCD_18930 [Tenuifilaceae bacterium CYCD]|nr:hypothetical protein CYCD_18930 [Tenuifilaceae bacterium CYCD]
MRISTILMLLLFPLLLGAQNENNYKQQADSLLKYALQKTRNPDSTKIILQDIERVAQAKCDTAVLAQIWSRYGFVNYWTGRYPAAIDYYTKAKRYYSSIKDTASAAWKGYMIAMTFKYWGKYHEAQAEIQDNIRLFEKLRDDDGILNCYIVAGYINQAWGNNDEAARICQKTLLMAKEQNDVSAQGYSLLAIGNTFLSKNNLDSAYAYISQAQAKFKECEDRYGIALSNRDFGTYYLLKGNTQKSLYYLYIGLDILKSGSNNRGYSEVLAIIGKVYLKSQDYENAVKNLEESQQLALQMELYEDIIKNYLTLSVAYKSWGKYDVALEKMEKYSSLKDSIFNAEKHFQIAELQTQYETEKKEQQIAMQGIRIEKNKSIQRLLILAFFLASTLAFFSFRWYRIKKRDNRLLAEQKRVIEIKNHQITDSINYAKRIQGVLLGKSAHMPNPVKDLFIFYQPKDIVSGDFYFIKEYNNFTVIAAADCTGHGVPGAFMSMLGVTLLNEVFTYSNPKTAAAVLEEMRIKVKDALNQTEYKTETKDGMDMALCMIDKSNNQLQYSGAYNSLYLVRNNELTEFKAVRNPVGVHMKELPFQNEIIEFSPNDQFYIFSDGYADQVNGISQQKFKILEFKRLIHNISSLPTDEQALKLETTIKVWMASADQTDDMLVVGFKM